MDEQQWWDHADEIADRLSVRLAGEDTAHWLEVLDAADVWCAPVLTLVGINCAAIALVSRLYDCDSESRNQVRGPGAGNPAAAKAVELGRYDEPTGISSTTCTISGRASKAMRERASASSAERNCRPGRHVTAATAS